MSFDRKLREVGYGFDSRRPLHEPYESGVGGGPRSWPRPFGIVNASEAKLARLLPKQVCQLQVGGKAFF